MRYLWAAGEIDAGLSVQTCTITAKPKEVIKTDTIGDLIQVTLVRDGTTIDLWTEDRLFRSRDAWLFALCLKSGNTISQCTKH